MKKKITIVIAMLSVLSLGVFAYTNLNKINTKNWKEYSYKNDALDADNSADFKYPELWKVQQDNTNQQSDLALSRLQLLNENDQEVILIDVQSDNSKFKPSYSQDICHAKTKTCEKITNNFGDSYINWGLEKPVWSQHRGAYNWNALLLNKDADNKKIFKEVIKSF